MTNLCLFCGGDPSDSDHRQHCDGRQGQIEAEDDLRGMVHRDDPVTALEAAALIARHRTKLQDYVLQAFADHGPMTDAELEALPEFRSYGPSTLRKRRSELYQMREIVAVGERRNDRNCRMLVWDRVLDVALSQEDEWRKR